MRAKGRVTRIFTTRGFGFIDDDGTPRYFHAKNMRPGHVFEHLSVGENVEFKRLDLPNDEPGNGRRAVDVISIEEEKRDERSGSNS